MNDYSSWGVTADLKLKPDITAYGGEITSTVAGRPRYPFRFQPYTDTRPWDLLPPCRPLPPRRKYCPALQGPRPAYGESRPFRFDDIPANWKVGGVDKAEGEEFTVAAGTSAAPPRLKTY